jgi:hypothetical protein
MQIIQIQIKIVRTINKTIAIIPKKELEEEATGAVCI